MHKYSDRCRRAAEAIRNIAKSVPNLQPDGAMDQWATRLDRYASTAIIDDAGDAEVLRCLKNAEGVVESYERCLNELRALENMGWFNQLCSMSYTVKGANDGQANHQDQ